VVPYAKGEGASQMVSDFISADYGWLHLPCGLEEARQLFKAGKNWGGYFTNSDIVEMAERAMDILEKYSISHMMIMSLFITMLAPTLSTQMVPCLLITCQRTS
jgi:hypothetical protein